jgi:hypothetical protein
MLRKILAQNWSYGIFLLNIYGTWYPGKYLEVKQTTSIK